MSERKYLPTLAELVDRLSISQLKEVFIPQHKGEYSQEIKDIVHDIQLVLDEQQGAITAETIRAIVVLAQMNLHIQNGMFCVGKAKSVGRPKILTEDKLLEHLKLQGVAIKDISK